MHKKIITVANEKGGVGKSTISANLAVALANMGLSVNLVDTDLQSNAIKWAQRRGEQDGLMPIDCGRIDGSFGKRLVHQAELYDVTIVDTAGADSSLMRTAILLSDLWLLPVLPSQIDIDALPRMVDLLLDIVEETNTKPNTHLLLNRVHANPRVADVADVEKSIRTNSLLLQYINLVPHRITASQQFNLAWKKGRGVADSKAKSKAKDEIEAIAAYVCQQLNFEVQP